MRNRKYSKEYKKTERMAIEKPSFYYFNIYMFCNLHQTEQIRFFNRIQQSYLTHERHILKKAAALFSCLPSVQRRFHGPDSSF